MMRRINLKHIFKSNSHNSMLIFDPSSDIIKSTTEREGTAMRKTPGKLLSLVIAAFMITSALPHTAAEEPEIVAISAEDMVIEEYSRGDWRTSDEDGTRYFDYNLLPDEITLTFNNGDVKLTSWKEISKVAGFEGSVSVVQSPDNCFKAGDVVDAVYTLTDGLSCSYRVSIVETSINCIFVSDAVLKENVDGAVVSEEIYSDDGELIGHSDYFKYDWYPAELMIEHNNYTVEVIDTSRQTLSSRFGDIAVYDDDQSASTPWGPGEHTATFSIGAFSCECHVTIVPENAITGIFVDDIDYGKEGRHRSVCSDTEYYADKDLDVRLPYYTGYETLPDELTIFYEDGTSEVVEISRYRPVPVIGALPEYEECNVGYENRRMPGEYKATLSVGEYSCEYKIIVPERMAPGVTVLSVEIDDVVTTQFTGADLYAQTRYYSFVPEHVKVTLSDGEVVEGDYLDMISRFENCAGIEYGDAQSLIETGTHELIFTLYGEEYPYNFTIEPFPVVSISADDMTFEEYTHGAWGEPFYNPSATYARPDYDVFFYNVRPDELVLTYEDGTEKTVTLEELSDMMGTYGTIDLVQTRDNRLEAGNTYHVTFTLFDLSCEYDVTVTETSVDHLECGDVTVLEETRGFRDWERAYDDETGELIYSSPSYFRYYYVFPDDITIVYKDGSRETLSYEDTVKRFFCAYDAKRIDSQDTYAGRWEVGDHETTLVFGAFSCTYTVHIISSRIGGLSVSVGSAEGAPGESVTVTLNVDENPGFYGFWTMLYYDKNVLTLEGCEFSDEFTAAGDILACPDNVTDKRLNGTAATEALSALAANGEDTSSMYFKTILYESKNIYENVELTGIFATLTFRINDDAVPGDCNIGIMTVDGNNITTDFLDIDVELTPGCVRVEEEYNQGDVDGDGSVTMKDVLLLRKIVAGSEVPVPEVEARADVDGDGNINIKDVLRLRKLVAGVD